MVWHDMEWVWLWQTHLHGRRRAGLSSGQGRQAEIWCPKWEMQISSTSRKRPPFGGCFHASISLQLRNGLVLLLFLRFWSSWVKLVSREEICAQYSVSYLVFYPLSARSLRTFDLHTDVSVYFGISRILVANNNYNGRNQGPIERKKE